MSLIDWGNVLDEGYFLYSHVIHRLVFQKIYCRNVFFEKSMYSSQEDMNSTQDIFLAGLTLLYIALIGQDNNVEDEFTEDARNLRMSNL